MLLKSVPGISGTLSRKFRNEWQTGPAYGCGHSESQYVLCPAIKDDGMVQAWVQTPVSRSADALISAISCAVSSRAPLLVSTLFLFDIVSPWLCLACSLHLSFMNSRNLSRSSHIRWVTSSTLQHHHRAWGWEALVQCTWFLFRSRHSLRGFRVHLTRGPTCG